MTAENAQVPPPPNSQSPKVALCGHAGDIEKEAGDHRSTLASPARRIIVEKSSGATHLMRNQFRNAHLSDRYFHALFIVYYPPPSCLRSIPFALLRCLS